MQRDIIIVVAPQGKARLPCGEFGRFAAVFGCFCRGFFPPVSLSGGACCELLYCRSCESLFTRAKCRG